VVVDSALVVNATGAHAIRVGGDIRIGVADNSDDDYIFFNDWESLKWTDSLAMFDFSNDLSVSGNLYLQGPYGATYVYFGDLNYLWWNILADRFEFSDDLRIHEKLIVDDTSADAIDVGGDIQIGQASGFDSDYIYFDSGTEEYLQWDNSPGQFVFSDDLQITQTLIVDDDGTAAVTVNGDMRIGQGNTADTDYLYFDSGTNEYLAWRDNFSEFYFSDDLNVAGTTVSQDIGIGVFIPNENLEIGNDGRAFFGDGGGASRKGLLIDGLNGTSAARIEAYDYGAATGLNLVINTVGDGNVGIRNASPNVALDVIGSIEYTGTITDVSDKRLKENFQPIDQPLDLLNGLAAYRYNMKGDESKTREYGLIAQEVQQVLPDLVKVVDAETGHLGVSYMQLIPILIEGVNALSSQNQALSQLTSSQQQQVEMLAASNAELNRSLQVCLQRLDDLESLQSELDKIKAQLARISNSRR
ncbi:MAG: tail fiber domain-containing protein, partial [Saprospiraceae bacterium]|nr:tail fiber domain-containing protein [Saprospiraceae bacterium]